MSACSAALSIDEAAGIPDHGIAPGTRWEDVPEDWEARIAAIRNRPS